MKIELHINNAWLNARETRCDPEYLSPQMSPCPRPLEL